MTNYKTRKILSVDRQNSKEMEEDKLISWELCTKCYKAVTFDLSPDPVKVIRFQELVVGREKEGILKGEALCEGTEGRKNTFQEL